MITVQSFISMQLKLEDGFAVFSVSTHIIRSGNEGPEVSSRKLPYYSSI